MRNYCKKCGRRRESKFMKKSPISNHTYCNREIRYSFNDNCYTEHLRSQLVKKGNQMLLLKTSLQEDNSSAVKMSSPVDKNLQTNLIDMINEIEFEKQQNN